MIVRVLFLFVAIISVYSNAVDEYFLNTVLIEIPNVKISCKTSNLTIAGKVCNWADCQPNGETVLLVSSSCPALEKNNLSVDLVATQTSVFKNDSTNVTYSYSYSLTGVLYLNETFTTNTPQSSNTNMEGNVTIVTTVFGEKPITVNDNSTAVLKLTWIHVKIDETKTPVRKNGGAVAVAIIEGIALICILAFFGYRVMVARSVKNHSANVDYSYDNNSGNIHRMNDIPPPRETRPPPISTGMSYPTNNPTNPTIARAPVSTPDLVVPASHATTNPTFTNVPNTNDPFSTLDSW